LPWRQPKACRVVDTVRPGLQARSTSNPPKATADKPKARNTRALRVRLSGASKLGNEK
jgi:hypothetical protein